MVVEKIQPTSDQVSAPIGDPESENQIKGVISKKRDDGLVRLVYDNPLNNEQKCTHSLLLREKTTDNWRSFLTIIINTNNNETPIRVFAITTDNNAVVKKFAYNSNGELHAPEEQTINFHNIKSLSKELITEDRLPEKIDFLETITALVELMKAGNYDPEQYWQVFGPKTIPQSTQSE